MSNKRDGQSDAQANLLVPRDEAAKKIRERIAEGQQIGGRPMTSESEVADARVAFKIWDDYNVQLLTGMFDKPSEKEQYVDAFPRVSSIVSGLGDKVQNLTDKLAERITALESLFRRLELIPEVGQGEVAGTDQATSWQEACWSLIHPRIKGVSHAKFEDGHFADAVESAFKEVNTRVKEALRRNTGEEKDGADLMRQAFSPNSPHFVFDTMDTESGRSIQQGYMDIFAGAMTGIRNPKAHENIEITEDRAIHFLILASLLMYKLDDAQVP